MDYTNWWLAISAGEDWDTIKEELRILYPSRRERNNRRRQINRIRAYVEGRPIQRRSGRRTPWIEDLIGSYLSRAGLGDADEILLQFHQKPPADVEYRTTVRKLEDLAQYLAPLVSSAGWEYVYIVPSRAGWQIYVRP